ncbi:MAG: hypothetical protein FWC50_02960 [Planctomycetaceae bacterium]|nr:hypothetical protein [Planctomycetaceae bacterium]
MKNKIFVGGIFLLAGAVYCLYFCFSPLDEFDRKMLLELTQSFWVSISLLIFIPIFSIGAWYCVLSVVPKWLFTLFYWVILGTMMLGAGKLVMMTILILVPEIDIETIKIKSIYLDGYNGFTTGLIGLFIFHKIKWEKPSSTENFLPKINIAPTLDTPTAVPTLVLNNEDFLPPGTHTFSPPDTFDRKEKTP